MNIDSTTLLKKATSCITEADFGHETVLLHLEDGNYHCMNATASLLWAWLNEPISSSSLHQRLVRELGYQPSHADTEIFQWVNDALANKLLELVSPRAFEGSVAITEQSMDNQQPITHYSSPKTTLFDVLTITQGNSTDFQTDNLETGS
ncbi:MAG: PqqD family protein [Legionella sp.]|jgi:hypothetical protein|nr:PqqD family protein [Legionella sp.]